MKNANLCVKCGRDFSSLGAFDKHFTGDRTIFQGENAFRCKTDEELFKAKFRIKDNGRWTNSPEMTEEQKQKAFGSKPR